MFFPGLVSISFREHSPEEIVRAASGCGLRSIEWGSDVHAPAQDLSRLQQIAALQERHGLICSSYGTYFRLGFTPMEELPQYIRAAKLLGTRILRLWAGRKKAQDCTEAERTYLFDQCRQAAALAKEHDVILCLECHRRSYTETMAGALELMTHVDSPHFRMYWQPNPELTPEGNLAYLRAVKDYVTHVHVFHWVEDDRLPLAEGILLWQDYLAELQGEHHLLLEFMPDDRLDSLAQEAGALKQLILT